MIINRIYETQNLLSLWLVSFLVGLRTYQHPCNVLITTAKEGWLLFLWRYKPTRALALASLLRFVCHTQTHTETPEGLLWRSDQLVAETSTWQHTTLTTDIHAPMGFEPTISAGERPQTYPLDRAANETSSNIFRHLKYDVVTAPSWRSYRSFKPRAPSGLKRVDWAMPRAYTH